MPRIGRARPREYSNEGDVLSRGCRDKRRAMGRVLLVGGTGFIGRHILRRLLDVGASVGVVCRHVGGLRDIAGLKGCTVIAGELGSTQVRRMVQEGGWDVVINVAGTIDQGRDERSRAGAVEEHLTHLLKLVPLLPGSVRRFVQAGSAMEYGGDPVPHREDMREAPFSGYAVAKVAATHYLQMLHRTAGFPAVVLRLFFVYGPGQDGGKFLPHAIRQLSEGLTLRLTAGEQTRDPVRVEDVAEAFVRAAMTDGIEGEVINVASGAPTTIADIAALVQKILGRGRLERGALPYRPGEVMRSEADISKLQTLLGFLPSTNFEGNIRAMLSGAHALEPGRMHGGCERRQS